MTLVGDDAKSILVAQVDADGTVDVPAAALKKTSLVLIGPVAENPALQRTSHLFRVNPSHPMAAHGGEGSAGPTSRLRYVDQHGRVQRSEETRGDPDAYGDS